jgi:hypothetical protein
LEYLDIDISVNHGHLLANALTSPHCKIKTLRWLYHNSNKQLIAAISSGNTKVVCIEFERSRPDFPDLFSLEEMTRGKSTVRHIICDGLHPSSRAEFALDMMHPDCTIRHVKIYGGAEFSKTINYMLRKRHTVLSLLSSHREKQGAFAPVGKLPVELFRVLFTLL